MIGGWQLNGIVTFSTGVPLAVTAQQNSSQSFSAALRPNVDGRDPNLPADRATADKLGRWFDTSVFSQPAPFTFGNGPRVLPNVRRDGMQNWDFSLFKNFAVREQMRFELRAEFFNFANHAQFGAPGQVFGNAQFGVINAQANTPRQTQIGLKFYF